ncbi:MAG TPA: ATP-binding protein [Kofleriaceae bacterium]|jgi:two-component sensor histidine kinase|nr:ATP-binding protein [Kofleriaceae bacterium]
MKLWRYLFLPREISAFERSYLRRMNRIALLFFYLHVPAFVGVAALAGTSMVQAAVLTPLVLIGPTVVYFWFRNPRALAVAYGFTAMVMGGLLVHFGQGPMQIEMHFYFFVLIALLAVFGNPAAIMTAAATVALHHLALWLLLPSSVFNYQASVWTVVVHAVFVVLESVAAIFVARSFFDNVIGLEKIVAARTTELDQRNHDMAMVLENVGQGFITVSADGTMSAERSTILRSWLGEAPASRRLADYIAAVDPRFAASLELGWAEVFAGFKPVGLLLDQLPKRIDTGNHQLAVEYRPIGEGYVPGAILVVLSNVTAERERERADAERRELMAVFERIGTDRKRFIEFCDEADELVRRIDGDKLSRADLQRQVRAVKASAAMFGIESIASLCLALEARLFDDPRPLTADERGQLAATWRAFAHRVKALLGQRDAHRIEVTDEDILRVRGALNQNNPGSDVLQMLTGWRLEPISLRFERVAEQANRLANRMGKTVQVEIEDQGIRLDPQRWSPFWSTFVHAVRNAVDHGVEDPGERKRQGKPEAATVVLRSVVNDGVLTIEIRDDGRGIDWDRVRARASSLGLPTETQNQLIEALFTDGVSTKDAITDASGRGVGLAALRAAARIGGGRVTIASRPQRGTSLQFEFPLEQLAERDFLSSHDPSLHQRGRTPTAARGVTSP